MFFDTHSHINDSRFDEDRDTVIKHLFENGVCAFTEIGFDLKSSVEAVKLAEKYDNIYCAVGVHPADVNKCSYDYVAQIEKLIFNSNVVAVGEIGLDYHFDDNPTPEAQKNWFAYQIEIAKRHNKPVVVHSRDAMADTIDVLKSTKADNGIIHCYSCSKESAKILLDMGFYISIAGPVTFKNSAKLKEVASYIPDDRILIETDCPYLAPEPFRGKRNCPLYVKNVGEYVASLRGVSAEKFAKITTNNAKNIYNIK